MNRYRFWNFAGRSTLLWFLTAGAAFSQTPSSDTVWKYQLLPGSQLTDYCSICGRPDILLPLRGTFELRSLGQGPLAANYAIENVAFEAGWEGGPHYHLAGSGSYQVSGEVALVQQWLMNLTVRNAAGEQQCGFTNSAAPVARRWPMLTAGLEQTNGTLLQAYRLDIFAAPFHEIWFSTRSSLTAGIWNSPTNRVSGGDLLSFAGRVVRRNSELTENLGLSGGADLGLKDAEVLPGGEVAFSVEQEALSDKLGIVGQGEILTDRGRVLASNAELIAAFDPEPGTLPVGINALQATDEGELLFSVQTNFFSQALGRVVRRGDLLSKRGTLVRTQESLVERFQPEDASADLGLTAVYVWPSGETWFATEEAFSGKDKTFYGRGQLLSDQGYVVYYNLDLVAPFQPLEDLADFGLDCVQVVTDVTSAPPTPKCVSAWIPAGTRDWAMRFESRGRFSRLEKVNGLGRPWLPASDIGLQTEFIEPGVLEKETLGFYRLRSW